MWSHRAYSDRDIICLECAGQSGGVQCDICKETKPTNAFPASARANQSWNIRCYDCAHPRCMFSPQCMTCTTCRDYTCQTKGCNEPIETLNSDYLPKTFEEVQSYACGRCQYVRCIAKKPDGSRCGKERSRKKRSQARQCQEDFTCSECLRGA